MVTVIGLVILAAATAVLAFASGRNLPGRSVVDSAQNALRTVGDTSMDAATSAKVKMAFALSKYVSAFDIHVLARAGDITLTGQVPSDEAREMAEVIAGDTAGVRHVVNDVTVDSTMKAAESRKDLRQRVADLEIHTLAVRALSAIPDVKDTAIDIRVERGIVFVSGAVETVSLRDRVLKVVSAVDGVVHVVNNLAVKTGRNPGEGSEHALARRVEFNLWLTKAFDLSHIQLQVANHTVILDGSARSIAERLLAERIAGETDGVQEVVNNLTLPPDTPRSP
jgi:osmotically-inducible protein OsmY